MWERRGPSGPYYYRKARGEGGRVRSVYVGRGPLAEACAELYGAARAVRAYREAAVRRAEATLDGAGDAVGALTAAVRARLDARMGALGFRYHRGEWRRPRRAGAAPASTESARPVPDAPGSSAPTARTDGPEVTEGPPWPSLRVHDGAGAFGLDVRYPEEPEPVSDSEVPVLAPYDGCPVRHLLSHLVSEAWALRVSAERAVLRGDGDRGHPVFRAFAAGAAAVTGTWGSTAEPLPTEVAALRSRSDMVARVA